MTHEEMIARWLPPGRGLHGVEIGPGTAPVPGLDPRPIYVDCFKAFGPAATQADYYGHACALPFHDHSLDYVVASHVLEHVANPIAALAEWYRVVRPGGVIYFVVPNRRATFDRTRELTPVEHLFEDFARGITACDATHIDEFAFGIDWELYEPGAPATEIPARRADLARGLHATVARGEGINLHFHTFEPFTLRDLLERLRDGPAPRFAWEILELVDGFPRDTPSGVLAVLRIHKGWLARAQAEDLRLRTGGDPRAALRPDAEPFAAWSARTAGLGHAD